MSLLSTIGSWIGSNLLGIANTGINAYQNYQNIQLQKETNQQNLDYARAQTQAQWERDDNAHQREVADLQSAGISPLANSNGAQTTNAMPFQAQAPQLDMSTMLDSAIKMQELLENKRQFNLTHGLKEQEHQDSIRLETEKINNELTRIKNDYDINIKNIKVLNDQLDLANQTFNETKLQNSKNNAFRAQELALKKISMMTGGKPWTEISDLKEYNIAYAKWKQKEAEFLSGLGNTSESESTQGGGGFKFSLFKSLDIGANGQGAHAVEQNQSQKIDAEIEAWYRNNPVPIYVPKK